VRVLVTGATGFVGRWLVAELADSGHEVVSAPGSAALDIADSLSVAALVVDARPDTIAHLAGVAFGPEAVRDPAAAERVNVGGTKAVAAAAAANGVPLLAVSSSEVYRVGPDTAMPLDESAPLGPRGPYGRTKLDAERAAIAIHEASRTSGLTIVRPFNHIGPGQRDVFVVPALARRVLDARAHGTAEIPVGNIDVRRDLTDVRDVVHAYRLLLEDLASGSEPETRILNVASGRPVAIGEVIERLAALAGHRVAPRPDAELIRTDDPLVVAGDASRLRSLTGWEPRIALEDSLRDVLVDQAARLAASPSTA
jgi:GDP-4-dehydro-6-deoxy-D-mannose reductase